jgi:site-specific recombinase XerD
MLLDSKAEISTRMHTEIIHFLEKVKITLSPASFKAYQSDLLQFSSWLIEKKLTSHTIAPQHISLYFSSLLEEGTLRSSIVRKAAVLRRFFTCQNQTLLAQSCIAPTRTDQKQNDLAQKIILLLVEKYGYSIPQLQELKREHIDLMSGTVRCAQRCIQVDEEQLEELRCWLSDHDKSKEGRLFPYSRQALKALIKARSLKRFPSPKGSQEDAQLALFAGTIPLTDYQKKHPRS